MEKYYDTKKLSGYASLAKTASLTTCSTSPTRSHGSSFVSQRTSSSPSNAEPEDLLTVFQASPLAYTDGNRELQPLGLLDFESERRSLTETLQDAVGDRIAISIETATTNLLGAFLSKGQGHILHFSCHGHPKYLAVEDGWGHSQTLHVSDLKEWIIHGGQSLDFVFVSACHSRAVGDAFIEAGVPHVVCCHTVDMKEGAVHNIAAIEFEKAFYRALAHGRLLSEAFNLAVQETFCSPYLQHLDRLAEAQKFVLLPEQANHNVPIFFTSRSRSLQRNRSCAPKRPPHCAVFDPPPEILLGRELDMYRVISALKGSRLVRVSGPRGVGKSALLKACCRYVSERSHIFAFAHDDVLWVPMASEQQDSAIYACFSKLFETFRDNGDIHSPFVHVKEEGIVYRHQIIRHFRSRRSLLVFDSRGPIVTEKLFLFLKELLQQTNHVKVIVVHPKARITSEKMPSAVTDIELPSLDFSSTVKMFGWMNQYVKERKHPEVGNPKEFADLVNPEGLLQASDCFSRRIFSMLGEGIPQHIQNAARDMTVTEYYNLIKLAKKTRGCNLRSRAALEKKRAELNKQIQLAVEEEDFDRAQELQDDLNDLDLLREEFPSLTTLEAMLVEVSTDYEFAKRSKAWTGAGILKKKRDVLETKIQTERAEMNALGINYPVDMSKECFESLVPQSSEASIKTAGTAGIRDTIKALENSFQKAMNTNDFQKANLIDKELSHLRKQRTSIPDSTQLSDEIFSLKRQLREAKMDRNIHEAETIYARLECLQQRLGLDGQMNHKKQMQSLLKQQREDLDRQLQQLEEQEENTISSSKTPKPPVDDNQEYSGVPLTLEGLAMQTVAATAMPKDAPKASSAPKCQSVGEVPTSTGSTAAYGMTVASSTYGEDRVKVTSHKMLDPYGDKGTYTGTILRDSGMPHGHGRMLYEVDGRTYEGNWRHGRWHGFGRAAFANGDSFVGQYRYDQRHGRGKYCWNDGCEYDGDFYEDKRHGEGTFKWPDGALYVGEFRRGKREGHGKYTLQDGGYYEGSWTDGRYDGYGICKWKDGRSYKGEWNEGQRHGRGTYCWNDGREYDGDFYEDELQGKGTFKWPDGALYVGEYLRGKREGHGKYTLQDGGYYEGSWTDGRYDGYGICKWKDGRSYKGEWKEGQRHGQGTKSLADGSIRHEGQWISDEPVSGGFPGVLDEPLENPNLNRNEPMRASVRSMQAPRSPLQQSERVFEREAFLNQESNVPGVSDRDANGPPLGDVPRELAVDSDRVPEVPRTEEVTMASMSFRQNENDDATLGMTVASSTNGEDRIKVASHKMLDPYGDKGTYTGTILRDSGMPHGHGRMLYEVDGRTYEGNWRHGRWHGFGRVTFANGDSFMCKYRYDQRHGRGKYCWNDGCEYDGDFYEDKRHGEGTFKRPDGLPAVIMFNRSYSDFSGGFPGVHDASDTDECEEDQKRCEETQPGAVRVPGLNEEASQDDDEFTITSLGGEIPMAVLFSDETHAHIRAEQQLLSESIQHVRERIGSAREDASPGSVSVATRNNEDERVNPRLVQDESEETRANRPVQESLSSMIAESSLVPAERIVAEDNEEAAEVVRPPVTASSEAHPDGGRRRRFWRGLRHSLSKR